LVRVGLTEGAVDLAQRLKVSVRIFTHKCDNFRFKDRAVKLADFRQSPHLTETEIFKLTVDQLSSQIQFV
jgi:hypothetical protein